MKYLMVNIDSYVLYYSLISPLTLGVTLINTIFFAYIYISKREQTSFATFLFSLNTNIFIFLEVLIAYYVNAKADDAMLQFLYTVKHIVIALYTCSIPFFFTYFKIKSKIFKFLYNISFFAGIILIFCIFVSQLLLPELFLQYEISSVTETNYILPYTIIPGILYLLRDILISFSMIVALLYYIWCFFDTREYIRYGFILIGIYLVLYVSFSWFIFRYKGINIFLFNNLQFPRLAVNFTIFILILGIIQIYDLFRKALLTEEAVNSFRKSEENLRLIGKNVNEIVWITDYPQTKIIYINSLFNDIFNLQVRTLYKDVHNWMQRVHGEDRIRVYAAFYGEEITEAFEIEYRIEYKQNINWVRDRVYPVKQKTGEVYRIIRIIEDVTEKKSVQEKLSYLAYHDSLTGLYNKKALYEIVTDSLLQMNRIPDMKLKAVLFVDLDNFKQINEAGGHNTGDIVLRYVSERLLNTLRETDYIFRFGGDEFVIVLNNIDSEYACSSIAQKIITGLSKPYTVNNEKQFLGVSIGIAIYPKDGISIDALVKNSDIALREAKRNRNSFAFYNTAMNIRAQERVKIEHNLRKAYDNREFELYFQPIYTHDGILKCCEALIRWRHEGEYIQPSKFIPIAEESELILHIGNWVLEEACAVIQQLNEIGVYLRIAVNISPRHFKNESFVTNLENLFINYSINPEDIELEITEGIMIDKPADTIMKMQRINQIGVHFSIDDFGTGYSSLSYIKQFPIAHLKIDRCFISDLEYNTESQKITNAITAMAHSLGIKVIAEGVERKYDYDYVQSVGCDFIQGYFLSKPVDFSSLLKLIGSEKIKSEL
jgi:diguanylate cyclase (GGDEF)-like protein/PAS domain S-box-containing protein